MDEEELFTVNVFQSSDGRPTQHDDNEDATRTNREAQSVPIAEFQNMISARVMKQTALAPTNWKIQGRVLELEHSNLAGPEVKFKTVINYERTLEPESFIGVTFKSQDGYITKSEDN